MRPAPRGLEWTAESMAAVSTDTQAPPPSHSRRPTTPAAREGSGATTDVPSARPTSVPDFDLGTLATGGIPRDEGVSCFLADLTVPVPTGKSPVDADFRTAFVFGHADGVSSIAEIAASSGLPLAEVVKRFVELVELGAITLEDAEPPSVTASGVFMRFTEEPVSGVKKKTITA